MPGGHYSELKEKRLDFLKDDLYKKYYSKKVTNYSCYDAYHSNAEFE